MAEKVFPEMVVSESHKNRTRDENSNEIDDTINLWHDFLESDNKLLQYLDHITKNRFCLIDFICLDIDLVLINEWFREASIPFSERSSLICLIHKYRLAWKNACIEKSNKTVEISSLWLKATRKEFVNNGNRNNPPSIREDSLIEVIAAKKNPSENEEEIEAKPVSIAAFIPFVNIVYDFFFDETPTLDAMKETLNLLGVMGALIFTIVITIPLSFDYDSYEAMLERWSDTGAYANCWAGGFSELNYFVNMTSISIALAFITVVLVIFIYVVLVNSSFANAQERTVWWEWTRWLYGFTFVVLTMSCITSFFALGNMLEWSIPNESVLKSPTMACPSSLLQSTNNPWGFRNVFTNWICGVSLCSAGLNLSLAIRAKAFTRNKIERKHFLFFQKK